MSNFIIVTLVTGFEAYCKTKFLELESEGINPDLEALITAFYSQQERAHFTADDLKEEAVARNRIVLQKIVGDQRINFQDYEEAKKAYRKAYGIKFGETGVSSNDLALSNGSFTTATGWCISARGKATSQLHRGNLSSPIKSWWKRPSIVSTVL